MNLKIIIFSAVTGLVVITIIVLFFLFSIKTPSTPSNGEIPNNPLPTSSSTQPSLIGLKLTNSTPTNGAKSVPTNSPIAFFFSQDVQILSTTASILPDTQFTLTTNQNAVSINPTTTLLPSTNYTVTVSVEKQTFFVSFTTVGPTPTIGSSTLPSGAAESDNNYLKAHRPDIYLSNYTPFSDINFSVSTNYSTSLDRFVFLVTLKNKSLDSRSLFVQWAKSKGLDDTQINTLNVSYK